MTPSRTLDVYPLYVIPHAERAAHLAVQAENIQDRYPEQSARLDAEAAKSRRLLLDLLRQAIRDHHDDFGDAQVDYHARRVCGGIMQDAYAAERAKAGEAR